MHVVSPFLISSIWLALFIRPRVLILDADMINQRLVFLGNLVRRNASMLQHIMGILSELGVLKLKFNLGF